MRTVSWDYAGGYIGAGNLDVISLTPDLNSMTIEIVYLRGSSNGISVRMDISIECINCRYFDILRDEDHIEGPGLILDAYLFDESDLISNYNTHQLHTKMASPATENVVYHHLQLIGEIDLNVLCETVIIRVSPMRPERLYDTKEAAITASDRLAR
ncbi:MAG: hypothetical protein ACYC0V_08475 [Armatimonadota bacterium]